MNCEDAGQRKAELRELWKFGPAEFVSLLASLVFMGILVTYDVVWILYVIPGVYALWLLAKIY